MTFRFGAHLETDGRLKHAYSRICNFIGEAYRSYLLLLLQLFFQSEVETENSKT